MFGLKKNLLKTKKKAGLAAVHTALELLALASIRKATEIKKLGERPVSVVEI